MEISAQQGNLTTKRQEETVELDELLHTTTPTTETNEMTSNKQTEESDTVSVPQVKTITEVDLKSHAQKSSVDGHSDDKSSCTCGK